MSTLSRRSLLAAGGASVTAALTITGHAADSEDRDPFGFCLNTSTVRGQDLSFPEQVELAASAGYQGIEPWIRDVKKFRDDGGNLNDVRKRLSDHGLTVISAIGFANWIVDDDQERAKGLETARHDMDLLRQIGGTHIAAPPVGATKQPDLDLWKAAERYAALLDVGESIGVIPQLELWGFSQSLSRLGELMFVAVESGHPLACVLPDVYHIYKGGSDFAGLRMINGRAMHAFHMNDYPAEPPREQISDADRVYPGDGVAPLPEILQMLASSGFGGMLSLELFNHSYWEQDAALVAKTGLEKMQQAVARAMND
jgi:sugar phosphate isomerase/epimerase